MNKQKITIIVLIVIIILLLLMGCRIYCGQKAKIASQKTFINALTDTLHTYINKEGQQVAKIALLETESARDFLVMDIKDATIQKLQEEVRKYKGKLGPGGSVTVVSNTTEATGTNTTVVTVRDTIERNDTIFLYPEYTSTINLGKKDDSTYWIITGVTANKDTTEVTVSVENSYTVVIGREKSKGFKALFKPKIPFVEITNENPYTKTKTLRSYRVSIPKPKRFGLGVNVGYGLTFDKSYQPIFRPYIGIGLNYNIINIF